MRNIRLNRTLLPAVLLLCAATSLVAKPQAKENIPGVAPRSADYFYTGKPYDADLGAYTYNFRNYDPELKRWTSADPSGFPEGANGYRYVSNRVTSMFDDLGLTGKSLLWLVGTVKTDPQSQQMQAVFDIVKAGMEQSDSQSNSTTHYLDDGDKFEIKFITSLAELNQIAGYSKVFYVGHGDLDGAVYLGETLYEPRTIREHCTLISDVQGCIDGIVTTASIVLGANGLGDTSGWGFESLNYLRE